MFNKSNFCHIASNNRNEQKGSVFVYKTTDTLAQVTQNGYFNEKLIDINLHDLIIHIQVDTIGRTVKKNVLIVTERTLDNVNTEVTIDQTLQNDLAELGEQVAGIEEKIPSNASTANQLATARDINSKITNCITGTPQDIKLELNNGTLTLKAGSKYYLPNGLSGSNPVFTEKTSGGDYIIPTGFNGKQVMLFIGLGRMSLDRISSGATAPSNPANNNIWYDTTNNQFKVFSTSTGAWTVNANISLPIGIATANADGTGYVSIDQVFNGFGYFGSTAFVLPGVRGMIPFGRNGDGTLNSSVFVVRSVLTTTDASVATGGLEYYLSESGIFRQNFGTYEYNPDTNYIQDTTTYAIRGVMLLDPSAYRDSGRVISFNPKQAFHAVDYSDTDFIAHQAMPSKDRYIALTLGASGTAYIAPADGYIKITKNATAAGQFLDIYTTDMGVGTTIVAAGSQALRGFCPVAKGDRVTISYTAEGTTGTFRFVYANGAK